MWLNTDKCLEYHVFDLSEYVIIVNATLVIGFSEGLETPLAGRLLFLFFAVILVTFEVFRFFVNGEVS
jgi:hypothetical protein